MPSMESARSTRCGMEWSSDSMLRGCGRNGLVDRDSAEALTLAYFGGYTQSQVAQLLQLPLARSKPEFVMG